MNGGAPVFAPLRAVRHAPVLVDDLSVAERLNERAPRFTTPELPLDGPELVRWARAWLVGVQGSLSDRGADGSVHPWTIALSRADLPPMKGDPERRRETAALALLVDAGLIVPLPDGDRVRVDESAFVVHRAGLELAWGAVCRAAGWEPASLLTARALADIVVSLEEPAPATLRELMERTGYAAKQVRTAVRRLTEARVIAVHEAAGVPSLYRFGPAALPVVPSAALPSPARLVADVSTPSPSQPTAPPIDRPATDRRVALRMTLNGVTVALGAGLAPHVELDPDGVPHLSFDPPPGA